MSRKHYQAIARVIATNPMTVGQRSAIVDNLAAIMQADNPAFSRIMFERACFANASTLQPRLFGKPSL